MSFENARINTNEVPSKERLLGVLGLNAQASPAQVIDAYVRAFELYRDQIIDGVYPQKLQVIKNAYESLEGLYATETSETLRQGRERAESSFAKAMKETASHLEANIETSTRKLEGDIGEGVDMLWGMFGKK